MERSILELTKDKRIQLISLCRGNHVKSLEVFGSIANNSYDSNSDIDLLVSFDESCKAGYFKFYLLLQKGLENLFGRKVDLVDYEDVKSNIRFLMMIDKDLIVLYGKRSFELIESNEIPSILNWRTKDNLGKVADYLQELGQFIELLDSETTKSTIMELALLRASDKNIELIVSTAKYLEELNPRNKLRNIDYFKGYLMAPSYQKSGGGRLFWSLMKDNLKALVQEIHEHQLLLGNE